MTEPDALARRAVGRLAIVLGLHAAHLGAQLEHAERRRVVDPDGQSERNDAASVRLFQSSVCRKPWRILPTSTRPSEQTMLLASCSRGISSEKTPTPKPGSSRDSPTPRRRARRRGRRRRRCLGEATLTATLRTNDVFPMPGRAATMVSSPSCSPAVLASSRSKPVGDAGDALAALARLGDLLEDGANDGLDALDAARFAACARARRWLARRRR